MNKIEGNNNHSRLLISGAGLRILLTVLSAVAGFIMTPFLIHHFGAKLYGIWILAASFSGAYTFLDLGLQQSVNRFVAMYLGRNDLGAVEKCINTSLAFYSCMGSLALLIAFGFTFFASHFVEVPEEVSLLKTLIIVSSVGFAFGFPRRALSGAMAGKLRYDIQVGLAILFQVVGPLITIMVVLNGKGLVFLSLVHAAMGVVRTGVWVLVTRRVFSEIRLSPLLWSKEMFREMFSFSMHAFVVQLGDFFRHKIDNFVIGWAVGPVAITHYSIATALGSYFQDGLNSIMGVLSPVFARQFGQDDQSGLRQSLSFGLRLGASTTAFMLFGLLAWGKPFIGRWMGPEYLDAYPCLVVLAVGLTFSWSQISGKNIVFACGRYHYFAKINTVEAMANLGLSLVLVQFWGIFGVAMGTFFPMAVVSLVLQPLIVTKVTGMPLAIYWGVLLKAFAKSLLALALPALLTWLLVAPSYGYLVLTGILCSLMYFPLIMRLNLSSQERGQISRALPAKMRFVI